MRFQAYSISWNLTQRCNLTCAHCYMSAFSRADASQELTTEECRRIIGEIAEVNPNVFLILTGGEPLLRKDLFEIADCAAEQGFTVVLGTNGVLLRETQARLMRQHGIQGASISLDSTEPARHDAFRHLPGAYQGAIRAIDALRAEGLDFSIHTSVTSWNVAEIPAMIDLATSLGARVLNLFFLVRTGRGQDLIDLSPDQYEQLLTYLARVQGVGNGEGRQSAQTTSIFDRPEDPWSVPAGRPGDLIIRAKCAPHFRRIIYALDPTSPLLQNYAQGSCPAGKHYCRIMPEGDVTPCPYMPLSAGNLRQRSFSAIWQGASALNDLRNPQLGGRCGACEFSKICGGCRCRAYATYGDYLAEDPGCSYQPGRFGGRVITLPEEQTFGLEAPPTMRWSDGAAERLKRLPSFARGMVVKGAERYAAEQGIGVITPEVLQAVRERAEARFGRAFKFTEFSPPSPASSPPIGERKETK
jgi:radical SAM protein with 4Fe4S-binding SPASM domain